MIILQATSLHKSFDQAGTAIQVLNGIDFSVNEGETVAILGQSGSGKSTLLSLLSGLDHASQGSVAWAGQVISGMDEAALAKFRSENLSIVFQQFHLMSYLTALENVRLPLEIARKLKDAHPVAQELLRKVGLSHRANHLPSQLSGGEKQRVAIARAMATQPKLLLADEPSGNLDAKTGDEVMGLLFDQVASSGMAMILVTHNEALARRCQRQLYLRSGKLEAIA